MRRSLGALSWPLSRLGEALEALGRPRRAVGRKAAVDSPPAWLAADGVQLGRWIESTAGRLGLEAEPVEAHYPEVERLVLWAGPALLCLPGGIEPRYLALLRGDGRRVVLLAPDLSRVRIAPEVVRAAFCQAVEAPLAGSFAQALAAAGVRGRRRARAQAALLRQRLIKTAVGGGWLIRPAGGASLWTHVREERLARRFVTLLAAHTGAYVLWVGSWWLLGWMTLQDRFEPGWLVAWLLLLLTLIPFRVLTTRAGGELAIRAGALLKRRLLFGALRLEREEVHHFGVGQLLGRVIESEVVESMALAGGFLGLTATIELVVAGLVLGGGAGSVLHAGILLGTAAVACLLGLSAYRRRQRWTEARLDRTNDLVERMVGHRTRLAQEPRNHWNDGEDRALERYLGYSADFDRSSVLLRALVPRGWIVAATLALAPAFVGSECSTTDLAVAIGGMVLASRALQNLVEGQERVAAAAIAWERIQPFWRAASRPEPSGHPGLAAACASPVTATPFSPARPLLDVRGLVFRYRDRGAAILHGVETQIHPGDRLLLEGPSGGGKSTLAMLLAGSRLPDSGLVLLDGLDRETVGADHWRRRIAMAPQFHDNHVLMGTFAFNALLGRCWPPRPADLAEAERVCRALGLGPLLDRMPAGLLQVVGETGWQLSHGERSRLYLARALLQQADVLILDESFAALDPETMRQALGFVLEEAATLLVIAHP